MATGTAVELQPRRRPYLRGLCAVLLVTAAACAEQPRHDTAVESRLDEDGASTSTRVDAPGLLASVDVQRSPNSTISAVVEASTTQDAEVSVSLSSGDLVPPATPPTERGGHHRIPVVGMRADTTYQLEVVAETPEGGQDTATVEWTTGPLPAGLPPVTLTAAQPDGMAGGYTLFNAMSFDSAPGGTPPAAGSSPGHGYVLAVDDAGQVVWYYETGPAILDVTPTPRGTLLLAVNDTVIREIDLLGTTVRELAGQVAHDLGTDFLGEQLASSDSRSMPVESAHHEVSELDDGNLLTLSTELLRLDPAQAAALCPGRPETDVISDVVVELTPQGRVVQEWRLADVFDPAARPGTQMCVEQPGVAPPTWFYPAADGTSDWTHANAVVLDRENNQLIVSLRHLDEVVALRYHDDRDGPAGELLWSLGANGSLEMTGAGTWNYHQHGIKRYADGTLIMYDNGNGRPGTAPPGSGGPGSPPRSRAVLFAVDEEAGTVTQLWEHHDITEDGRPMFTPFLGDADLLDNGNVLITHGAATTVEGGLHGRLIEVVPGSAPDGSQDHIVFDLTVGAPDRTWTVYRAERVLSLYGEPWQS